MFKGINKGINKIKRNMFKKKEEDTTEPKNISILKSTLEWFERLLYLDLKFNEFILTNSYNFNSLSKFQKIDIPTLRTRTQGYLSFIEERLSEINDKNSKIFPQHIYKNTDEIHLFLLETQQKQEEFSKILFEETRKAIFYFVAFNAFWHLEKSGYNTTEAIKDLFSNKTKENKEVIKNSVSSVFSLFLEPIIEEIKKFDNKVAEWAEKSNTIDEEEKNSFFSSFWKEHEPELKKRIGLILDLKQSWLDKDTTKKTLEKIWAASMAISLRKIHYKYDFIEPDLLVEKKHLFDGVKECFQHLTFMTQINEENKQTMLTQIDNNEQLYNSIFSTLTDSIQEQQMNAICTSKTAKLTKIKPITEPTIKPTTNKTIRQL